MQDEREGALPCLVAQDRDHVVVGIACVNDQRQSGLARGCDMCTQALSLRIARRLVVKIVEAGLADRDHLRVLGQSNKILRRDVELLGGIVRMRADGAEHFLERLCNFKDLLESLHARRYRDHAPDTSRQGAGDDGRPLLGKIRKIQMAMAVDKHQAVASGAGST